MNNSMEKTYEKFADETGFSGICLVKTKEASILEKVTGFAHRGFQVVNDINTRFDVASITKVFTATAILQLTEKGLLRLNDKITTILDLSNTQIPDDVEIKHLLSHTSGIADDAEEELGENYSDLFIQTPNYSFRKLIDYLPNFVHKKPNFKAGTKCMYNNCAYILLGMVIEKLSQLNYKDYLENYIFNPCKMCRTKFCSMDEISDNTAENYIPIISSSNEVVGWRKNIYSYPPIGGTDGGVYTTAYDLDSFIRNIHEVLSVESRILLFSPQCSFPRLYKKWKPELLPTIRFGFGFEFVELGKDIFCMQKDGINEGVSAVLSHYPKYEITIIIISNQCDNVWELQRRLQTILYEKGNCNVVGL